MGIFYVLKIVQMVPNSAKHHNYAVLWTLAKSTFFFPCIFHVSLDTVLIFWGNSEHSFELLQSGLSGPKDLILLLKNIFRKRKKPIVTWPWPTSTKIFLNWRLIQFRINTRFARFFESVHHDHSRVLKAWWDQRRIQECANIIKLFLQKWVKP